MYEYEISIIMVILCYTLYVLLNKSEMSEKGSFAITGTFLVIGIITFVSNIPTIQNNLNDTFGEYFGMISFGVVIILVTISFALSMEYITKSIDYMVT